jgi:hypothetical protein
MLILIHEEMDLDCINSCPVLTPDRLDINNFERGLSYLCLRKL